jgi:hypothetical protein
MASKVLVVAATAASREKETLAGGSAKRGTAQSTRHVSCEIDVTMAPAQTSARGEMASPFTCSGVM